MEKDNLIDDLKLIISDSNIVYAEISKFPEESVKSKFLRAKYGTLIQKIIVVSEFLEKYYNILPTEYMDGDMLKILEAHNKLAINNISVQDGKVIFSNDLEQFINKQNGN